MPVKKRTFLRHANGGPYVLKGDIIVHPASGRRYVLKDFAEHTPKHPFRHIKVIPEDAQMVAMKERYLPEEFGLEFA